MLRVDDFPSAWTHHVEHVANSEGHIEAAIVYPIGPDSWIAFQPDTTRPTGVIVDSLATSGNIMVGEWVESAPCVGWACRESSKCSRTTQRLKLVRNFLLHPNLRGRSPYVDGCRGGQAGDSFGLQRVVCNFVAIVVPVAQNCLIAGAHWSRDPTYAALDRKSRFKIVCRATLTTGGRYFLLSVIR
jgi:hypothetical protein